MVLNSETKVFGVPSTNEAALRSGSKIQKYYGLTFPIGANVNSGYFSKISGPELLKRNLIQLLRTSRGERFMLPLFGTNLKKYLFEPLDEFLFLKIKKELTDTVTRYAPYVTIVKIDVIPTDQNQFRSGLFIKMYCSLKEEADVVFEVNLGLL